ncbi:MAG TPA: ABC transporter permease, partial [Acidimicrobiales bacterium]|nr:ABC transporter permease [Acidimicrobiales bacterium]
MQTVSEVAGGGLGDAFVPDRLRPVGDDGPPARVVSAQETLLQRLAAIWTSRELLIFLTRKEIKVRYQASVLGLLWSMLNPTVVLLTYYLVFTYFLKSAIPDFALFLFAGLLVWNLFSLGVQTSATSVVGAAGIVKKVAFPREVLPLAQVGVAVFFFSLQLIVMALFLVGFRITPTWSYVPLVIFGLIDVIVLTAGLALLVSGLTVFLRDMEHLIMVLMQAWFWLVPIVYSFADDLYYRFH